ncbi:blastoderm-specific protein 25D isoform X2 [Drosophila grimshawi]|uniref:GH13539 n=1 Tax=Drosophila grimshawi TaxID=7222 RepID=B4JPK9_DROGR|nr:blastoderm-specific protein 25D isoform X2 [Drosophila grimshawi]EDV98839.1 GH13539 [Drosophila grimshawi]
MEVSADPYEQKLYQMFQSCETSQQRNNGLLDEASLTRLCQLLQLRDQGSALISSLTASGSPKLGVSFGQFKEALLNFLGTEFDGSAAQTRSGLVTPSGLKERSLVISDEPASNTYVESPPEGEASDREVSPKLIVGTKKYGRRSRPHHNQGLNEIAVTDSDNTDEDQHKSLNGCSDHTVQVQRSSSQSDLPGSRRLRSVHYSGSKLKRCASLPARKNLQSKMINSTALATTSSTVATQVGSGHGRSNLREAQQECSSVESLDIVTPQQLETISAHSIIETWEMASITNSGGLLHALGFDEEEVNLGQLTKVLEEELRGLEQDPQSNVLRALVALQSVELGTLRQAYRQQHEENLKLRADNKAANQRVAMLAAEVDERHASLEDNCKQQVLQLEQRHASVVRELTQRITNDRDHWTGITSRLETQIKSLEQEEIKLRTDLELVRTENTELEAEQQKAHQQMTELLEQNIKLNQELARCEPLRSTGKSESSIDTAVGRDNKASDDDEMLLVMEKMTALQMENAQLRDKTDELTMEIENLCLDLARTKSRKKKQTAQTTSTPAAAVVIATESADSEELDAFSSGLATKRRGDSPSKTHITEESPRLGKQRKCSEGGGEVSDNSGDWLALNSELHRCKSHEEELSSLRQTVAQLEQELQAAKTGSSSRATTPETRCKELENSLEQMQRAYEDCEDYWQSKLSEERQIFEKERHIYEDEQMESDKKFTELMEKVREYEEQFSKDGRLSPIDERDMLEQQYLELEVETTNLRNNSIRMLEEKSQQISELHCEIEDLRTRLGESVEILTGASEINPEALHQLNVQAGQSPASSPISYLWHQSTIQEPLKTFNGIAASESTPKALALLGESPTHKATSRNKLTTSETSIFSTTPLGSSISGPSPTHSDTTNYALPAGTCPPAPICKPKQAPSEGEIADCETSSTASNKSFDSHSVISTSKASCFSHEKCSSPNLLKEELKRLKFFELSLREQIKDLSLQRDGLVMELQQLQEARPVLEKAYARTTHPTLQQRLNQLELRNRHLQNVIKQQQKYTESLMQQSWRQHQVDLNDLHGRIEAQTVLLADQTQRLQNADILVKDLYVENSHLTATVQRLEQQRARVNLIHQHQQQHQLVGGTISGLSGIP